jgi:hypothetical protein
LRGIFVGQQYWSSLCKILTKFNLVPEYLTVTLIIFIKNKKMKTFPVNHFLLNYCLQRPGTVLAVLVVCFGLFISMDQTIIVDSCSKELLGDRGKVASEIYTTTYIGWLPAHPQVFKFYLNTSLEMDQQATISFSTAKSCIQAGSNFIERQWIFFEKVIRFLFQ